MKKKDRTSKSTPRHLETAGAVEGKPSRGALSGGRVRLPLFLLIIAAVGFLCYGNTFEAPFVFDDYPSIVENTAIHNLSEFLGGEGYRFNPRRFVGYLTLALNYRFGGLDVTGYHLVNLLVHLGCSLLVFALGLLSFRTPHLKDSPLTPKAPFVALFASLLFVAHPVQTQAVTYVTQRLASLATLFYLASLVSYLCARLSQERRGSFLSGRVVLWYLIALVSALMAMKTKEIAWTLPIAAVLLEFSFFRTPARSKLLFLLPLLATLVVVPLGIWGSGHPLGDLLSDVNQMTRETDAISRGSYLLTQFCVIATYLRLLILPTGQNLDYDYPMYDSLLAPRVMASFLLLAALVALALWLYRRSGRGEGGHLRMVAFGFGWFFLTLSVESSVIPIRDVIFEHRLYLPSVGVFLAAAAAGGRLTERRLPAKAALILAVCVVLALSLATWQRNRVWASPESLWTDVTEKSPQKARGFWGVGEALDRQGRYDEAIDYYEAALERDPLLHSARLNLGVVYGKKGQFDQALRQIRTAMSLVPEDPATHYNLGFAYEQQGMVRDAIGEYRRALEIDPDYKEPLFNLGPAYGKMGMMDEAIRYLRLSLENARKYRYDKQDMVHFYLGMAYDRKGLRDRAAEEYREALEINPDLMLARMKLLDRG